MKLWSDSWTNGDRIPARYAAGCRHADGGIAFSDNVNPHLAWSDVPAGTKSLVLICHDFDVPVNGDEPRVDGEIPADVARRDFFHWVLVDLPPVPSQLAEGAFSRGFTARGKPASSGAPGTAREGLNDYTGWFAADPDFAGQYHGYDGPFPPPDDSLVHHYVFTLYATALARLPVEGGFTGAQVRESLAGHVLGAATFSGTYTLNPRRGA